MKRCYSKLSNWSNNIKNILKDIDMLKNIIDPVILAQQIMFAGNKTIDKQVTF